MSELATMEYCEECQAVTAQETVREYGRMCLRCQTCGRIISVTEYEELMQEKETDF